MFVEQQLPDHACLYMEPKLDIVSFGQPSSLTCGGKKACQSLKVTNKIMNVTANPKMQLKRRHKDRLRLHGGN